MSAIIILIYTTVFAASMFCAGVAVVWIFEWRMNSLRKMMGNEIRCIENLPISNAVMHIRTYRIKENYRRRILNIEKNQKFILEKILMTKKGSFKNTSLCQNRMTT